MTRSHLPVGGVVGGSPGVPSSAPTVVQGLHIGRRDHYHVAADVLARRPARVVLMQRSSSLVLGAESGWDAEQVFVEAAERSIADGAAWFHIASSSGIAMHLARSTSWFPDLDDARRRLQDLDGAVAVGATAGAALVVRDLPGDADVADFKLDRQARVLAADFGDDAEAVIVNDIGDRQCSLHVAGPCAREVFELCVEFWSSCPTLTWSVLAPLLRRPAGDRRARAAPEPGSAVVGDP